MSKFDTVPVDHDTKVLAQTTATFGQYDALYQQWYWDGITAESLIFVTDEIDELSEDELLEQVKASPMVREDSQVTVARSDTGFTFFNFNFVT